MMELDQLPTSRTGRPGRGPDELFSALDAALSDGNFDLAAMVRSVVGAVRRKAIPPKLAQALVERMMPPLGAAPVRPVVHLDLPRVRTTGELDEAHEAVLMAMAKGEITPGEAVSAQKVIDRRYKARIAATCGLGIG